MVNLLVASFTNFENYKMAPFLEGELIYSLQGFHFQFTKTVCTSSKGTRTATIQSHSTHKATLETLGGCDGRMTEERKKHTTHEKDLLCPIFSLQANNNSTVVSLIVLSTLVTLIHSFIHI
jgi:hypothetical protein